MYRGPWLGSLDDPCCKIILHSHLLKSQCCKWVNSGPKTHYSVVGIWSDISHRFHMTNWTNSTWHVYGLPTTALMQCWWKWGGWHIYVIKLIYAAFDCTHTLKLQANDSFPCMTDMWFAGHGLSKLCRTPMRSLNTGLRVGLRNLGIKLSMQRSSILRPCTTSLGLAHKTKTRGFIKWYRYSKR